VRAIRVVYKPLPHVVTPEQALKPDAPRVYRGKDAADLQGNVRPGETHGDKAAAEAALKKCPVTAEGEFRNSFQHHVCLETHGAVVDYRGGDTATVYASTQGTFTIPADAAQALGLKGAGAVTSVVEYMGGGFGSKFGLDVGASIACSLSKEARTPVRLMLSRSEEYMMAGNRSGFWIHVRAGADGDGKLRSMIARQYRLGGLAEGSQAALPYIYDSETSYSEIAAIHTNQDASCAFRAPGHPQASFPMESIMDDLAAKLQMDPVEFRKKNTSDAAYHRQLDAGARAIGWERRPRIPGGSAGYGLERALRRGFGCGCATWGGGGGPECEVQVSISPSGEVVVQVGTQDLGTGTRTYTTAIVAEELGLPVWAVQARIGRSTYGAANSSGGSTTAASLAPAVKSAAYNARKQLFAAVAVALHVSPDELVAAGRRIAPKGKRGLAWKQACATLGSKSITGNGEWIAELAGDGVHGVHFAEVEVDIGTGKVRVLKLVGIQDCGLCLNRLAAESQINGGMIQGLGYALYEQHWVDASTGLMLNATMDEYKLPGCLEMPELVPIVDDGDTRNVVIGLAEPGTIPTAGAIGNAVFNATAVRVTSLPITPDKVLAGLHQLRSRRA
ncbi:MAG TPA: xanthine dehydrogenase family protein molybdopterin-binding subunit, partial [Chthonomonadales bacterium]|nr:xanthine dehydrogenase family protein molybdopterin-binding subunit [Chthonomonadales bacterium]